MDRTEREGHVVGYNDAWSTFGVLGGTEVEYTFNHTASVQAGQAIVQRQRRDALIARQHYRHKLERGLQKDLRRKCDSCIKYIS